MWVQVSVSAWCRCRSRTRPAASASRSPCPPSANTPSTCSSRTSVCPEPRSGKGSLLCRWVFVCLFVFLFYRVLLGFTLVSPCCHFSPSFVRFLFDFHRFEEMYQLCWKGFLFFFVFYWVLLGFPISGVIFVEFSWVSLGCTRIYWVLLVSTGFDWVWLALTGFDWVLLGFTGFYWVLLGLTGFYWVLLGFTGF